MTIYDYYLKQQKLKIWYDKFQSTSNSQSGKTFSYINTNFRFVLSFIGQFNKILSKLGTDRKEWKDKLPSGQEADKHRVVNLVNAGFIKNEDGYYSITSKGIALMDLNNSELNDNEKWLLLFFLILDYKTCLQKLDIISTVKDTFNKISEIGYDKSWINNSLKKISKAANKKELFDFDIFWLISFSNDADFLKLYFEASETQKNQLKEYVINCSLNPMSTDLIAHKFKNSGAYSVSTFIDDCKMLYFTDFVIDNCKKTFEEYVNCIVEEYCKIYLTTNKKEMLNFINNHKSIYIKVKQNLMGGL